MSGIFQSKKRKILHQLSVPDEEYDDLSPKGSVDIEIRQLVDRINLSDAYVTTSSCAGRLAVFLEGATTKVPSSDIEGTERTSAGGKGGGGRWLFVSHKPLPLAQVDNDPPQSLMSSLGFDKEAKVSEPEPDAHVRYVHFKFEPMILHILTSSLASAQHALNAAMSAGFRESGISGVTSETPMVAVRSSGLAFDSIIGYLDPATDDVRLLVTDAYFRVLSRVTNQRFTLNRERTERFFKALLDSTTSNKTGQNVDWESADVRRERKQAEGLQRREELAQQPRLQQGHDDCKEVTADLSSDMFLSDT